MNAVVVEANVTSAERALRDAIAQAMSNQAKLAQLVTRCGGDEALLAKLKDACANTSP